jgi:glucose/arabinose dehydrogenase
MHMTSRGHWFSVGVVCASWLFAPLAARAEFQLEKAFPNLTFTFPTDIHPSNDGSNRLFVVEKRGVIWVFAAQVQSTVKTEFLNISNKVRTSGEAGLLGLALHPDYKNNGQFYVFYVSQYPYRTIVARYQVSADPNVADPGSESILIDSPQSTVYHNGGQLAFGPDGYLYIGMGDNFTSATAQNLADLPGSILRIDIDVPTPPEGSAAAGYEIPADNPFANNTSGYREEIYAYGFRNPWRFCIDRMTGEMWVSDVGQDTYEEIDIVEKGRNYGWPLMEGPDCYGGPCDPVADDLALPFYWYTHAEGVAVIGGYRYWGRRVPELSGYYIFADYTGGTVWGLRYDGAAGPERFDLVVGAPNLLTFGLGPTGDVLAGSSDGYIYHLTRVVTSAQETPPSATRLLANYPNPFNPSTTIHYHLAREADVTVEIYTVDGARVARYALGSRAAGDHRLQWNGRTAAGPAASGVYFCRLVVDGRAVDTSQMVLVQ